MRKNIPAAEKAVEWRKAAAEFSRINRGWKMEEIPSTHGQYVFWGSSGYTILIDSDGKFYRGSSKSSFQTPLQWLDPKGGDFISADQKAMPASGLPSSEKH